MTLTGTIHARVAPRSESKFGFDPYNITLQGTASILTPVCTHEVQGLLAIPDMICPGSGGNRMYYAIMRSLRPHA